MRKKFWFLIVIVLLIIIGGFFYFWIPNHQSNSSPNPPTLFGKDDYKVEERDDGKYIVVDKVGLTAKVPDGWNIKFEGNDYPEPEYWVDLYSPDIVTTTSNILINGCRMSITTGEEEKNNEKIKSHIEFLKENPTSRPEEISYIYKDYIFELIEINTYQVLKWTSPEKPMIGQIYGIDIPIGNKKLIDITITSPPEYGNQCLPIWEEFIKNLKIK